jgi:transcription initiation factor TFIIB
MTDLWPRYKPTAAAVTEAAEWYAEERPNTDESSYICKGCDDPTLIESIDGIVVCKGCGAEIDIPIDQGAEYRWFAGDSGGGADPSRCSFPVNPLMPESSLGTMIINGHGSAVMRRIKRYHMWNLMPYRERTLWSIFESLTVRATNSGISLAVVDEAKELFAQMTASTICRGQPQRDALLAACIWEALKRHGTPRMPKDVADIFNIPMSQLTKGIKQFQTLSANRTTAQRKDTYTSAKKEPVVVVATPTHETEDVITARALQRRAIWQKTATKTTSYEDFIVPFLTNLSIQRDAATLLEGLVRDICAKTEEFGIVPENTPPSLTASVIAFAAPHAGISLELTQIARVCGISVITIQKCLKRLTQFEKKLLTE